jgi:hypothetical protein
MKVAMLLILVPGKDASLRQMVENCVRFPGRQQFLLAEKPDSGRGWRTIAALDECQERGARTDFSQGRVIEGLTVHMFIRKKPDAENITGQHAAR